MIEDDLSRLIREGLEAAASDLGLEKVPSEIELSRPRQKEHGDFATNVALALAPELGRKPRDIADAIAARIPRDDLLTDVQVAGPGFINLFVATDRLYRVLEEVERLGPAWGRTEDGKGERVLVEFVSANPTGPLHVGTGRNAAIGDSLARVLDATGRAVEREYYVNDAGTQAALFGQSLEARYLERFGQEARIPEEGYHGAYLADLAAEIAEEEGDALLKEPQDARRSRLATEGMARILGSIRATLERFGVRFDAFFHESSLHGSAIEAAVEQLRDRGLVYENEGAVWFRSAFFGDEKDRVLIRKTGEPTYFAADCAYLLDKLSRGFDRLIYVWGADHHGAVKRLQGAVQGYGVELDRVEFHLTQLVALYRGGEPVRMSKRTGDIITLDELLDEVGTDAARYTLLTRSIDTALDFDIEAVARQTLDNPVYYVQYAHARIASILRHGEEQGVGMERWKNVHPDRLQHETELNLIRRIAELPGAIGGAAALRAPSRLTHYAESLAGDFHRFYTECRVVTEDRELTQARLHLAAATKRTIANVLALLGVSAPESMERLEEEAGD